jgi:hypothetical protein
MSAAKVSTVRLVDPRIEPQPDPLYTVTTGPKQNQFYKLPPSGLSNSYITFNNLTTLGTDRAYLDSFELEITATFTFTRTNSRAPTTDGWTFDSFPFNKCCEEVRVNVNGGAFFSQPLSYLRAKERYWDTRRLAEAYANVCPYHKPLLQHETACANHPTERVANSTLSGSHIEPIQGETVSVIFSTPEDSAVTQLAIDATGYAAGQLGLPSRCLQSAKGYSPTEAGVMSAPNNSIVPGNVGSGNQTFTVTWREPIFASPFSSRLDDTYGRPLYNITSLDIAFNMQDLGNMIRVVDEGITSYTVNFDSVQLCYQVETLPPGFAPPAMTVVPYRRLVPYITDASSPLSTTADNENVTLTSGVYTLNEIPTAIWIFAAPSKAALQTNQPDVITYLAAEEPVDPAVASSTWADATTSMYGFNKLFGFLKNVNITCANTTQILNTAAVHDLYRIAKANGCQDNFEDWSRLHPHVNHDCAFRYSGAANVTPVPRSMQMPFRRCPGAGSVLRLIPGTDIVIPEQELVPGANANNLVFQVSATFDIPKCYGNYRDYSLWLLFEYVGVATITPGQCQIAMNPLGDGDKAVASAPVVSAAQASEPTTDMVEGSGFWDKIKSGLRTLNKIAKETGIVSKALKFVPHVGDTLSGVASAMGYGWGGRKRPRVTGGAVMGMGDFI